MLEDLQDHSPGESYPESQRGDDRFGELRESIVSF